MKQNNSGARCAAAFLYTELLERLELFARAIYMRERGNCTPSRRSFERYRNIIIDKSFRSGIQTFVLVDNNFRPSFSSGTFQGTIKESFGTFGTFEGSFGTRRVYNDGSFLTGKTFENPKSVDRRFALSI